ncbi:hypothetical protein [Botrimarina hoheduenensis]|uniref:Uncharacterized protein n=1 Tax=Botrimarina hoheduenensis TaxID=2528000 RepID=A0A5C5VZC8_9BACT|nr:hypothetical protein [Botrimarina hoheduenensis]TWT43355.1 hypothetical protein Pla111_23060 [Botrimarina hoheduenensis]
MFCRSLALALLGLVGPSISTAQESISPGVSEETIALSPAPIATLGVDIRASTGEFPEDRSAARDADLAPAFGEGLRVSPVMALTWTPAAVRTRPLYFEEINAERYGYGHAACLQPVVSAAHFFGTAAALPYLMGAQPPCECVYTLGHYRPGDCAPNRRHRWPMSARGLGWQTLTTVGLVALIP